MENIKLSIITPVYNSKDFIEGCINNVIDQKCQVLEHLILDAGSTDGTLDIIKDYAAKYPHIRYISEPDKGQSDAMNKGITMAKAPVISFLNADDGYFTYTLNRIVKLFDEQPNLNFAVGNLKLYDLEGELLYINRPQRLQTYHQFSNLEPFPINPSAYFYKKAIHDEVGLYTVENHHNMDYEFILKAVSKVNMVYFNEDWGYAVHHENAKTVIDVAENKMQERKDKMFQEIYSKLPLKTKVLASIYKLVKRIKK